MGSILHREDPLEKGMATRSSILAWGIPWTEEPGGPQPMGSQESDATERLPLLLAMFYFLVVLGLRRCVRAFSSCSEWGATLPCGARASRCGGFSCG